MGFFLAMSSPGDVPNLQYSQLQEENISLQDFSTPLTAVVIKQLLKDDYKSRRPRRYLAYVLSVTFCQNKNMTLLTLHSPNEVDWVYRNIAKDLGFKHTS